MRRTGSAVPGVPAATDFWVATASGRGTQALTWEPEGGRWAVVVMNAAGSRGVTADVGVGAKSDVVLPVGFVLLGLGIVGLAGAAGLIWVAVREPGGPSGGAAVAEAPAVTGSEAMSAEESFHSTSRPAWTSR